MVFKQIEQIKEEERKQIEEAKKVKTIIFGKEISVWRLFKINEYLFLLFLLFIIILQISLKESDLPSNLIFLFVGTYFFTSFILAIKTKYYCLSIVRRGGFPFVAQQIKEPFVYWFCTTGNLLIGTFFLLSFLILIF
jgi:hypothetical protein